MAKQAFGREEKEERRKVILAAAAQLFVSGEGTLPSVSQVAEAAGLAKGTVYLYFTTKGAIFAALLVDGWSGMLDDLDGVLAVGGRSRKETVAAVIAGIVGYLDQHLELLRLDALGHGVFERNLSADEFLKFKEAQLVRLVVAGSSLETELDLKPGRGLQILTRTYALTRGLWQTHASAQSSPGQPFLSRGFSADLGEALGEYWRGALAGPDPSVSRC